ncbi:MULTISPECIES: hypothetical protein [Aminobacter]|uniref:hypothetical protein n=1 Tax=Aminobacter TaxID=31988 RepID=UPI000D3B5B26|nr:MULTISPECIES: hypothetical protein [Aminobacter]AWC25616.1 hypothetical protein CO731_05115 [Aminobacter sp. MSH1]CAI2936265.1 conserved protein of unknown function [Aminobacter niigataensis]
MMKEPSEQAQLEAFEAYRTAFEHMLSDRTFENAMTAKRAYWRFISLVDVQCAGANVLAFRPARNEGGAA